MTIKGNKDVQDVYHAIESNDWVREPDQDPLFASTAFLMSSVGNNGANNTVFLDSSTNNFTVTRNGDTYQGSFSPHNPNGWSAFFDGSGDYLQTPAGSATTIIDGTLSAARTFTIESWIYMTAYTNSSIPSLIGDMNPTAGIDYWSFGTNSSGQVLLFWYDGAEKRATGNTVIPLYSWAHIAVSVSSGAIKLFVNGQLQTITGTSTLTTATGSLGYLTIGQWNNSSTNAYFGYVSNLRIVKGTALYTANFTPPTAPLTAVANTSLLTLQSNGFKDNSTNNFTITRNGDTRILPFSPFRMDTLYNANTHGGSAYFDGTGDTISIADNVNLEPSNKDFSIEFWIYPLTTSDFYIYGKGNASTAAGSTFSVTRNVTAFYIGGGSYTLSTSGLIITNQWNHYAFCRNGINASVFINGILAATRADLSTSSLNDVTNGLTIGGYTGSPVTGYMSNFRYVLGTAVYTGNFTPPSAPVTTAGDATIYSSTANVNTTFAAANTSLLCNFTNAGIIDLTGKNNIYTVGATQVSTSIFKDGKSFYFDGSGYYYFTDDIQYMYAKPITIEAWLYPTTSGTSRAIIEENTGGDNGEQYIGLTSGNVFYFQQNNTHGYPVAGASTIGLSTTATVNSNTWTHVAIVFSTSGVRMYVNGVLSASNSGVRYWNNAARKLNFGVQGYGYGNYVGYIEDLRITLGARYNANFTPLKLKRY